MRHVLAALVFLLPLAACGLLVGTANTPYQPGTTSDADLEDSSNGNDASAATPTPFAASPEPSASASPTSPNDANTVPDASPTPGAVFNCNTHLFPVCDGFETVPAGAPPDANHWTLDVAASPNDNISDSVDPNANFIRVSTTYAHRGHAALQIHGGMGAEHIVMQDVAGLLRPSTFLPAPNNTFYVRMWFYFDGFSTQPSGSHMYIINASGPLKGKQQYQKFGGNEHGNEMDYSWFYHGPDAGIVADTSWPSKVWTCYETEFKGDTGELHVWIDDHPVAQLTSVAGDWSAPAYNRLTLGWEIDHVSNNWPGVDIYLDEIAYSYQRIGCTP